MLTKTLQIAAICFSMANPSNFHIDQPKKASQNFELKVFGSQVGSNTNYDSTNNIYYQSIKMSGNAYNEAMMANVYRYDQTAHNGNDNSGQVILATQNTYNPEINIGTTSLYAIQVTPYQFLTDVTGTTRFFLWISNNVYIDTDTNLGNLKISYKVITSTESYFANYLDISNYATINENQYIFNDLTNAQNGFLYNIEEYTQNVTTVGNSNIGTVEQQLNIEIVEDKTNYIYVLVTPYVYTNSGTPYGFLNGQYSWLAPTGSQQMVRFEGTMITGTIYYDVIDIPGIMFEILTMPFTFISIAFNLTLFPGTPYQVNISNLFLSILGIFIFAFIIKKLVARS